jgi:dTDP-4-dehydrorhamnose reductase
MACIWPLTWSSELYGDFRTVLDQENHKPTPSYYVFKFYSSALGNQLVSSAANKSYVRVVSALSQDRKTLWTYLLNKSPGKQPVRAYLNICGFSPVSAEAIALATQDISSDVANLEKLSFEIDSEIREWQVVLPGYSLTMLTFHR